MAAFFEQLSLIITNAGVVLGVFVTLLLTSKSVRESRANLFLSILLLAMSFSILHIQYAGRVINHFSANVFSLGDPTFLLIGPLLWLYMQELTGHRTRWSFRLMLHFIPFLTVILLSTTLNRYFSDSTAVAFLNGHRGWLAISFWVFMVIQFSGYLYLINKRWQAYRQLVEQEVSNTENVSLAWVQFFMGVFLGILLFFLLVLLNLIHHGNSVWVGRTIAVVFSLSVFALGYKGILQKEIFHLDQTQTDVVPPSVSVPTPEPEIRKPDQQLIDRLLRFMADEKPYLDPELTLSSLAKRLNLSRSELSQLINEGVGNNFYNFVNKYRVEQVKAFMNNPAMKHYNLLGLALEAGFKSKSTFNLIFKRFTGLTPSEYLQTLSK
ncbi:hypothetical protein GCM10023189_60550 [Nibrella saemangeumensis]|uniref:HTH araC/xylS-type domain-containing protein n=1 Tax=Nibrella saemangeumensis TaxID=1084526 RepID=A0ABP8NTP0_9BACT